MAELVVGVGGGLVVLAIAIELAELLIEDSERAAARRKHGRLLHADDRVGEHANRVFVAALRFVQHRFVVHDLYVAGRVLAGFEQVLFGLVELVELAIDLRNCEIVVGVVGHQVDQFLIDRQSVLIFFFGHQRLAESAQMIQLGRIDFGGAAIGGFGFGEIFGLRVGVAEQIEEDGRRIATRHAFEQRNGFGRFAFVEQKLRELFDGGLIFGIGLQNAAQYFFGLVVLIAQAIKAREPERGFGVGRLETVDLFVLFDGAVGDFRLAAVGAHVAEAADVNAREQAARWDVVGIAFEDFLGFGDGVAFATRLPIHFGEAFADYRGLGVERVGLFVELDGLRREVGLAGVLELLLVHVAHREVVVGLGAIGGFAFGSGGLGDAGFLFGEERAWGNALPRSLGLRRGLRRRTFSRLLRLGAPCGAARNKRREQDRDDGRSEKAHVYPKRKVSHASESRSKDFNRGISRRGTRIATVARRGEGSGVKAHPSWMPGCCQALGRVGNACLLHVLLEIADRVCCSTLLIGQRASRRACASSCACGRPRGRPSANCARPCWRRTYRGWSRRRRFSRARVPALDC